MPFETQLIDPSKLSKEEIIWLNDYHQRILKEIGEELKRQSKTKAYQFLKQKIKMISHDCEASKSFKPVSSIYYVIMFDVLTIVIARELCFS